MILFYHCVSFFGIFPLLVDLYQEFLAHNPPCVFHYFVSFLKPYYLLVCWYQYYLHQNLRHIFIYFLFLGHCPYQYTDIKYLFLKLLHLCYFTLSCSQYHQLYWKYTINTSFLNILHLCSNIFNSSCSLTLLTYAVLNYFEVFLAWLGCLFPA